MYANDVNELGDADAAAHAPPAFDTKELTIRITSLLAAIFFSSASKYGFSYLMPICKSKLTCLKLAMY